MNSIKMSKEKRGPMALEAWAKQLTDGYRGVSIQNMTTCWRNGLAFCALIHRFRPDLIDYDKLDPSDIVGNCSLAFDVAESKLGIPALLDPEDMVASPVPDRLSILTYVAQFYNAFKHEKKPLVRSSSRTLDLNGSRNSDEATSPDQIRIKRRMEVDGNEIMSKMKREASSRPPVLLGSPKKCTACSNPVFISERVFYLKKVYHSSCFSCHKCNRTLNASVAEVCLDGRLSCINNSCDFNLKSGSKTGLSGLNDSRSVRESQVRGKLKEKGMPTYVKNVVNDPPINDDCGEVKNGGNVGVDGVVGSNVATVENLSTEEDTPKVYQLGRVNSIRAMFDMPKVNTKNESEDSAVTTKQSACKEVGNVALVTGNEDNNDNKEYSLSNDVDTVIPKAEDQQDEIKPSNVPEVVVSGSDRYSRPQHDPGASKLMDETTEEKTVIRDMAEEEGVPVHRTPELLNIRSAAVLNVADQIRKSVPQVDEAKVDSSSSKPESGEKTSNETMCDNEESTAEESSTTKDEEEALLREKTETEDSAQNDDCGTEAADPPLSSTPCPAPRKAKETVSAPTPSPRRSPKTDKRLAESSSTTKTEVAGTPKPTPRHKSRRQAPSSNCTNLNDENMKVEDFKKISAQSAHGGKSRKDYPSELNPFECDVDDVSSTPIVNNNRNAANLTPKNPFEEDDETEDANVRMNNWTENKSSSSVSPIFTKEADKNQVKAENSSSSHNSSTFSARAANFSTNPKLMKSKEAHHVGDSLETRRMDDECKNGNDESSVGLNPSKIVASTPIHSFLKPYNPFEEEDDLTLDGAEGGTSAIPETSNLDGGAPSGRNGSATCRVSTISDAESISGSFKRRSKKKRRAPLPPNMASPQSFPNDQDVPQRGAESMLSKKEGNVLNGNEEERCGADVSSCNMKSSPVKKADGSSVTDDSTSNGGTSLISCTSSETDRVSGLVSSCSEVSVLSKGSGTLDTLNHEEHLEPTRVKKVISASPDLLRDLKLDSTCERKKKRRAPVPGFVVAKREVKPLPIEDIIREYNDLEILQTELERQGIALESDIRAFETAGKKEPGEAEQLDEMTVQLWSIVNEKNDILRRQTELEYLRRGHRLEELQADTEYKLRLLMDTPAEKRSLNHNEEEEKLLKEIVRLVDERNEVVEWLDYHRQMEQEEELQFTKSMNDFTSNKMIGVAETIEPVVVGEDDGKKKDKIKNGKNKKEKDTKSSPKKKEKEFKIKLGLFGKKRKSSKTQ